MSHTHTTVFRLRVRDHLQPPPVVVPDDMPTVDVVGRMTDLRASAAVVLNGNGRVAGILTEQDVTRRIACRQIRDQPIIGMMTRPVSTVTTEQPLYEAVGMMRRLRLHHMPVVDVDGELAGMLYLSDAMAAANDGLIEHIDRLTHETTLDGLREVKSAQVELAADLFADRVPAPEIQRLISSINNDIYRRVVRLSLAAMAEAGWGEPPVAFSTIVMGSGGRGESYLFPDQDNGFILADYPDDQHARIDPFFIELADRMTRQLDQLSFPLCRGGVMATNPVWRKSLSQWRQQVTMWIARRSEVALQLSDVLFDFRTVYGERSLAEDLGTEILSRIGANPGFLREMFGVQVDHRAGLGWFGRLLTERDDPKHKGELNLKYSGTLPLAEGVRLLSLREGIRPTSTLRRIALLIEAGKIGHDEGDYLRGAFDHITSLQLRQQIADYQAGRPVSNFVDPDSLTERELDMLKDAFRAINDFRGRIRADLTGEVF